MDALIFHTPDGGTIAPGLGIDDNSYCHIELQNDNSLTVYFDSDTAIEMPVGTYCDFEGERYTLQRPEALKMEHTESYSYTVTMEGAEYKAKIWKFRNPVDGRLKFPLTAKPREHVQMFVDNMNRRDSGWSVGDCIEGNDTLISYDNAYCMGALQQMADTFKTEFEIRDKKVSLHKVEYFKDNPLKLSYGQGNGFKSGVGRSNFGDTPPLGVLFTEGSDRNIDPSKYHNATLKLPRGGSIRFDGTHFEDEDGFDASKARAYTADEQGYSIRRTDAGAKAYDAEDTLDCTSVYPSRVGTVSEVVTVNEKDNFYDIIDDSIPDTLNFEDCLIKGEKMTVIFQSGELAGREFDVSYHHKPVDGKKGKRFEIVPQDTDGTTMPGGSFVPAKGNRYAVFHCMLPQSYINAQTTADGKTDATKPKQGAEWDMMRMAVRYLYAHETETFEFSGTLDGIWAKKNWASVGAQLCVGGHVTFYHKTFCPDGADVRITAIKRYLNNPYSPEVTLSNATVPGSFTTRMATLEATATVTAEHRNRQAVEYTRRSLRDARQTAAMLVKALHADFTKAVSPITVKTMMLLAGDQQLQFRFVDSVDNPKETEHTVTYDAAAKKLKADAGLLQHMTIGINAVSPTHSATEYKYWNIGQFTSDRLDDADKSYYLYAVCPDVEAGKAGTGTFSLSDTPKPLKDGNTYNFLVGVLNSEYDGERSFAPLYGFTEVLPGQITTDVIRSADGDSYFDMRDNAMKLGDRLSYNIKGDGELKVRGVIVQSESGDSSYIGVYRGPYSATATYFAGDEVTWAHDGITSLYRFIGAKSAVGKAPSDPTVWAVQAQGSKGADGKNGTDGKNGAPGSYVDMRFAKNGSTTVPPDINTGALDPEGWSQTMPEVGIAEYLWMSVATKSGDGKTLLKPWSVPVRTTGVKGIDGADGSSYTDNLLVESSKGWDNEDYPTASVNFGKDRLTKGERFTLTLFGASLGKGKTGFLALSERGEKAGGEMTDKGGGMFTLQGTWDEDADKEGNPFVYDIYPTPSSVKGVKTSIGRVKLERGWNDHPVWTPNQDEIKGSSYTENLLMDSAAGWDNESYPLAHVSLGSNTLAEGEKFTMTLWGVSLGKGKTDLALFVSEGFSKLGTFAFSPQGNLTLQGVWKTAGKDHPDNSYIEVYPMPQSVSGVKSAIGRMKLERGWNDYPVWSPAPSEMIGKDGAPGKDGTDGAKGDKGDAGPSVVYRGEYDPEKEYIGSAQRIDCVKLGAEYYAARIDAGTFKGISPADAAKGASKWNKFGASFESVATSLLLADDANIGGWLIQNGRLESQTKTQDGKEPMAFLDGKTGEMRLHGSLTLSSVISGEYSDAGLYCVYNSVDGDGGFLRFKNLGCNKEDVGKVIRVLYRPVDVTWEQPYFIEIPTFHYNDTKTTTIATNLAVVRPFEVVELSCFRIYSDLTTTPGVTARWVVTNREWVHTLNNFQANAALSPIESGGFGFDLVLFFISDHDFKVYDKTGKDLTQYFGIIYNGRTVTIKVTDAGKSIIPNFTLAPNMPLPMPQSSYWNVGAADGEITFTSKKENYDISYGNLYNSIWYFSPFAHL